MIAKTRNRGGPIIDGFLLFEKLEFSTPWSLLSSPQPSQTRLVRMMLRE